MIRHDEIQIRLTHIPTGLSVVSRGSRHRSSREPTMAARMAQMRQLLAAKVAALKADPEWREGCYPGRERVRSYHLHPYLGLEPFAKNERSKATYPFDGYPGVPVTPALLDRLMLERRRAMEAN